MRKELERRPLLIAASALLIGITSSVYAQNALFLVLLIFALRPIGARLLAASLFVVGFLIYHPPLPLDPFQSRTTLMGVVVSSPRTSADGLQTCLLASGYGRLLLRSDQGPKLEFGDRVLVTGMAFPALVPALQLPSIKAYRVEVEAQAPPLLRLGTAWRAHFAAFAERCLSKDQASLLEAIVFSSSSPLSTDQKADLEGSQSLYLVSEAGLHVLLLALLIQAAIGWLPRWSQIALLAAALTFYVIVSGLHPSTIRAAIFMIAIRSAYLFRREPDMLSALSLAALAILLYDPAQAFELGFQLTMVAVLALALFTDPSHWSAREAKSYLLRRARQAVAVVLAASLALAPLLAQTGHTLVGESLAIGLAGSFAMPVLLSLGLFGYLIGLAWPTAGAAILASLAGPMLAGVQATTHFFAQNAIFKLETSPFSGYWLVLLYGCVLLTWRPRVRPA